MKKNILLILLSLTALIGFSQTNYRSTWVTNNSQNIVPVVQPARVGINTGTLVLTDALTVTGNVLITGTLISANIPENIETGPLTQFAIPYANNSTSLKESPFITDGANFVGYVGVTPITQFHVPGLTPSSVLSSVSTAAGAVSSLTMTVTGASDGDIGTVGWPAASQPANGVFTVQCTATNVATVRFHNTNLITALDPASGTFKIKVFK